MIGIYFSGTGNTKHCTEKLVRLLDETAQTIPMEDKSAADLLSRHDFIVLAYPVQYSNMPVMVREFIKDHSAIWNGKRCSASLLRHYLAETAQAVRRAY